MALQFPTIAEKVVAQVKETGQPLNQVARAFDGEKVPGNWNNRGGWVFDDDTSVTFHGAGRHYRMETHLP